MQVVGKTCILCLKLQFVSETYKIGHGYWITNRNSSPRYPIDATFNDLY